VYVIEIGTPLPVSLVLVDTQTELTLGNGFVPPAFGDLEIRGGTLTLDLTGVDVEDGDTLTLFTYSSLEGSFDEIVIETTLTGCERVRAESTSTANGHYEVTLIRTDTCAAAADRTDFWAFRTLIVIFIR